MCVVCLFFLKKKKKNPKEIPFEVSDEVPWPHIPFWEEVIFPDEVYEILYEDDRDIDVDKLTEAEVRSFCSFFLFFKKKKKKKNRLQL